MPTDHAAETVVVAATMKRVLATIRDVASQPEWVREILEAEVLEQYPDGTPATGAVMITFALYNVDSGGTAMWMEPHTVTLDDGYFVVTLGKSTALPALDGAARGRAAARRGAGQAPLESSVL